jgi:hypothetical protein
LDEGLTGKIQAQVPKALSNAGLHDSQEWALPHASIAYSLFEGVIQARFDSLSDPDVQNPLQ